MTISEANQKILKAIQQLMKKLNDDGTESSEEIDYVQMIIQAVKRLRIY